MKWLSIIIKSHSEHKQSWKVICERASERIQQNSPSKCVCSSQRGSVRFLNCCNNNGYFKILWIGLIKYDSSVLLCCCFGLRAIRNSWSAWLPSSEANEQKTDTKIVLVRKWKMNQLDIKTMSKHCPTRSKLISSCRIVQFSILLILFNWLAGWLEMQFSIADLIFYFFLI